MVALFGMRAEASVSIAIERQRWSFGSLGYEEVSGVNLKGNVQCNWDSFPLLFLPLFMKEQVGMQCYAVQSHAHS